MRSAGRRPDSQPRADASPDSVVGSVELALPATVGLDSDHEPDVACVPPDQRQIAAHVRLPVVIEVLPPFVLVRAEPTAKSPGTKWACNDPVYQACRNDAQRVGADPGGAQGPDGQ